MSSTNPISNPSSPTCQESETPSKQRKSPVEIASEQVLDATFLKSLLAYKVSVGPLPSFDDGLLTQQGQQLLEYVNADLGSGLVVDEALFREKVSRLRSKYNQIVEERRGGPGEEDLSTDSEKMIFMLSERIWDPEYEDYGFLEVNVDQEVDVSGDKQGLQDQDQDDQELFLFPNSTCEDDDDISTLVNLNIYGVYDESFLPPFIDEPGQRHSLADFINSNRKNRGQVNEALLRDKVFKLQTRYKKIVEEKGKNLTDEDFSTYNEHLMFQLSRKVWGKEEEVNAVREVHTVMEAM